MLGSCFGLGYIRQAPGTFGSLPGIALYMLTRDMQTWAQILLFMVFCLLALGVAEKIEKIERSKDPEEVVIDEAAGMWLSLFLLWDTSFLTILAGFMLFRFFDIFKPFPVNLFQTFRGGTGILADDLAAGMLTNFILRLLLLKGVL